LDSSYFLSIFAARKFKTQHINNISYETYIPALKQKEKEQTRVPQPHGFQERQKSTCCTPCQGTNQVVCFRRILRLKTTIRRKNRN